jgi:large-conductance mechanosensitive channel
MIECDSFILQLRYWADLVGYLIGGFLFVGLLIFITVNSIKNHNQSIKAAKKKHSDNKMEQEK